jgi:type I restriction-modification system DNA methylase subunit
LSERYVSEDDFVANFLLPKLKEAAIEIQEVDVLDFHTQERIREIGRPCDLSVWKGGKRVLVIEAKFKKKSGNLERDIEPRDPEVIKQAVDYAVYGGFPYYATCNTGRLILYQMRQGYSVYENEIDSFEYSSQPLWAVSLLRYAVGLEAARLKAPDEFLVSTLREAFSDLWPEFLTSLRKRLSSDTKKDMEFRKKYEVWLDDQGMDFSNETHSKIAKETAYLQLNKLVFYKVIRSSYPQLKPLKVAEDEDISESLQAFYKDVLKIDYKAVYQSDVISEIPFTARADIRLRTLIDTIDIFDFSRFRSDFVGRVYEELIPPQERKDLGQFYTPPTIVNFITKMVIKNAKAVILDPSCGSGGFLVGAYHRLRELNGAPPDLSGPLDDPIHQQLLDQIYGIDINQFPAHLSVINLAVQNARNKSDKVNVAVKDFFDILPGIDVLTGFEGLNADSQTVEMKFPTSFDIIVANPPYIEQELMGSAEKKKIKRRIEMEYRHKAKEVIIGPPIKRASNQIALDKQSDIFIYFFVHALSLLGNGGSLGFISSNKWLEVDYGESFQEFLLNYARIEFIVEFDRAIFSDAEVNTAITILQKESDRDRRNGNITRFVRIKRRINVEEEIKLIQNSKDSYEDERIRINVVKQGELIPGKWNVYLRAPPIFQQVINNPKIKRLEDVADVFRGPTTGYDKFFLMDSQMAEGFNIEEEFLTPCVSSPKVVKGLAIDKGDVQEYLLMVNKPKDELRNTRVIKYIERAESTKVGSKKGADKAALPIPEHKTLKARKLWYSLPEYPPAPILFVKMIDKRPKAIWNKAKAQASNLFYYIIPKKRYELVLLGYLNSSFGAFLMELYGRSYGGGVLELAAYELKQLPVINPAMLSEAEITEVSASFVALADTLQERISIEKKMDLIKSKSKNTESVFEQDIQRKLKESAEKEEIAHNKLDRIIYRLLGLNEDEIKQLTQGLREFQEIRKLRSVA